MRIPLLAAVLLAVFAVVSDLYILKDIRQYSSARHRRVFSRVYTVFMVLCWILVAVTLCFPKRSEEHSILGLMWMLFTTLSIYIPKFLYCICSLMGRLFSRKGVNRGALVGVPVALLVFIVIWWGCLFTRHDIVVNEVDVVSDKLPESFDGFEVLQFSDAHVGTWGTDTAFVSKLVDSINNRKADLILFTGDIVNRRSSELDPFVKIFSRLKAPYGVYGVHGNHDYAGYVTWKNPGDANKDVARLDSMMRVMGWKILNNHTGFVAKDNDSIVVIGVENWGEPPFNQLGDLGKSYPEDAGKLHGLNDGMFKILLTHNPEHWSQVVTKISNIDLSLAGHTHAMQCMIKIGDWKWSPSKYRYEQWGGMYSDTAKDGNPMNLYVNIGVGEVGFPARIGAAKPERTLFRLHTKKNN